MTDSALEHILSRVKRLPTLPVIVLKLLKLIESPTATATELSEVVAMDQGLTARILRLVNSSFYALHSEVVRVSHAIALLGLVAVRDLALGLSVVDMFGRERESPEFHGDAVWEHTLGCAICARLIAERVGYVPVEEAFVAGLLHDIGKLVLFDHCRADFDAALRTAREELIALPQAERLVLGTDHAEVGGVLAEHWRLPKGLRGPIRGHHALAGDRLTDIVYLANALAKAKQIGAAGNAPLEPLDERTMAAVGLDEPAVLRLMGRLRRDVERAKTSLTLRDEPRRMELDRVDTEELRVSSQAATRVLLIEEAAAVTSLVELVLLDRGHSTCRTTDVFHSGAAVADVVVLDFPKDLERGARVRAELEARLDRRRPVVLLRSPRRPADVVEAVNTALAASRV